ncbi:hypothetical protein HG530_001628 [Fusarium avenaceum]|nr:hypothetical protein HG530_001628 [Fusarium avenaceum]
MAPYLMDREPEMFMSENTPELTDEARGSLQFGELDALVLQNQGFLSSLSSLALGKIFKFSFVGIDVLDELLDLLSALLELESEAFGCKGTAIVTILTGCGYKHTIATFFTAGAVSGMGTADGEPQVAHGETIVGDLVVDSIRVCHYSIVDTDLLGVGIESRLKILLDFARTSSQVSPFVSRSALRSGLDLRQDQLSYQQRQHMLMRKPWAPITPGSD